MVCDDFPLLFAHCVGNLLRNEMTPDEQPAQPSEEPKRGALRRPRRRSRGGRGRRRPAAAAPTASVSTDAGEPAIEPTPGLAEPSPAEAPIADSPIDEIRREVAEAAIEETHPERERERRDFRPASKTAITEAIDDVSQIIASLRQVLEQMEELLETIELAEIQKTADEREIESLRRALKQLDRRGGPSQHSRGSGEHRR